MCIRDRSISLQGAQLNKTQSDRSAIINAYIQYQRQDYTGALQILSSVTQGLLSPTTLQPTPLQSVPLQPTPQQPAPQQNVVSGTETSVETETQPVTRPRQNNQPLTVQQVDALLLSSFCYQKLGNYNSAIAALLKRESALIGKARTETTRYIWQVIDTIDTNQRILIINTTNNPLVRNRLEQSLQGQVSQNNIEPSQFTQWQAEPITETVQTVDSNWSANSPRKIAVLLPLGSKFNKAAQALMDGIKYQNELNSSPYRPQIQFYDIGQSPSQVIQYYAAAVNSGADFIIGPLGKQYADYIANLSGQRVPTILLGGDNSIGGSTLRFTMSPEAEGVRVAERARQDGHSNAAILSPDSVVNQRIVSAFSDYWLSTGGKISTVVNYNNTQFDHSTELKRLFDIGSSESRYRNLSDTLGFKPKFTPQQRKDLDFVFMLASNESGRIVRPQINFFSGSKIPVYSTSNIFNGIPSSVDNIDLDNTIFPIMPWVFKSKENSPYAGQLNSLFAMGADAYEIAGNYNALRGNSELALNANTGRISIGQSSNIVSQPLWAKFVKGEAALIETLGFELTPNEQSPTSFYNSSNAQQPLNGKGVYNDKTWDTGQSRRKTSP